MATLCFLHGALGAQTQFQPLVSALTDTREVRLFDFSGHGEKAGNQELEFGIKEFGQEVLNWMEEENIDKADFFGYSMGGYVALWLAANFPEKVGKIMTLATKFDWTPEAAEKESRMLDPEKVELKVPIFAAQLSALHGEENWKRVVHKTAIMMNGLGAEPLLTDSVLLGIPHQVQVMVGDSDAMVSLTETIAAFKALPNARLAVLPKTKHPFEMVNPERLQFEIKNFFS